MATETYLLSVQGTAGLSYNECVLAFQSTGLSPTDTLDTAGDLCSAFEAHAMAAWQDLFPGAYQVGNLSARRATPKPSATAHIQYQVGDRVGSRASDFCAYNLCPSIFLVPPMGTKSGGRIFLPCAGQGDVINNTYLGGYIASVDTFMSAVTTGLAGSGTNWQLAIYSRKNSTTALALSWVLSPRIGFQSRRRKPSGLA